MKSIALTDIGQLRTSNQDYCYSSDTPIGPLSNLYLVADGMGGHQAGEFASRFAAEQFVSFLQGKDDSNFHDPEQLLSEAILTVNESLYQESSALGPHNGTGTTLVAATISNQRLHVVNIGDSRLYRINQEIQQITQDHSYADEMVRKGQIDPDSEAYWSKKNILTRAVGPWESVLPDYFSVELEKEDWLLLCSDGLSSMVLNEDILHIIKEADPKNESELLRCGQRLIEEANKNGGADNITLILIAPNL